MGALGLPEEELLRRLAIALCLGLFLGLEREYSRSAEHKRSIAGLRTHGVIALLGAVSTMFLPTSPLLLPLMGIVVAALVVAGYVAVGQKSPEGGVGITSEVVILLAYLLGAMVMSGWLREAVVVAGAVEVMLSAKAPLQRFVLTLSPEDWVATMKFVVVTLVVLPVLPNARYGPYGAFNPFKIWLMVVMISGISFLGYALTKAIGAEKGLLLTGLIGGLASSTAVSLSSAKQSKDEPSLSPSLAVGTLLACTVMLPRLALIIWALCPPLALGVLPGLGAMLMVSLSVAVIQYRQVSAAAEPAEPVNREQPHRNPFEMHSALKFAVVFAFITLLVKWVEAAGAGAKGLYLVSFVAGLVEMDAIAVTLAEQVKSVTTALPLAAAAKGVVLAAVANTLFKGGLSYVIGSREMGRKVLPPLLGTAVVGAVVVWFGP